MASGFTNSIEAALLNHLVGKSTYTPPATVQLALHVGTTPPDVDAGTGLVEPTDANYSRISMAPSTLFGNATPGAPTVISNAAELNFGTAAADYPNPITHVVILDDLDNIMAVCELPSPQGVLAGVEIRIPVGQLQLKLGKQGDTF